MSASGVSGATLTVALAGSPNTGKSTVFNFLTGLSQRVGNWPGKTVERKTGTCQRGDAIFLFVDLPGSYSLTANSLEEEIARDYIIQEAPDVVAVVVDASSLERNLYLVCELLELGVPLVVVLNMMDIADGQGLPVDPQALQSALGVPVVPTVATRGEGMSELLEAVQAVASGETQPPPPPPPMSAAVQALVESLDSTLPPGLAIPYPRRWALVKLLEGDRAIVGAMKEALSTNGWRNADSFLRLHEDAILEIAGARYEWVAQTSQRVVHRLERKRVPLGERADRILTHPLGGVVAFLGMLAAIFWAVFSLGTPLQERLDDWLVQGSAERLESALEGAPDRLVSLLADGVIGGAGLVLTFLPILGILFLALALLEDLGYMARAAFVMDRFMHLIGLRGKSFLPLFLGFGCNVPAVLGTRIIEDPRARRLTTLLAPLVPCTARLAVIAFLAPAFFGRWAALASWVLVAANLVALAVAGIAINRWALQGEQTAFIMELPLYHKPDPRTIGMVVWNRTIAFVRKAGTVILIVSVAIWLFSYLPYGRIDDSVLAWIGKFLEPIGRPMGLDWKMLTALLTSIVAKENAIATLGVLYGVGEKGLVKVLPAVISHASALSFLVTLMLFIPCAATVAVMKREMGSWKWFSASFALMIAISFSGGVLAYHLALRTGL